MTHYLYLLIVFVVLLCYLRGPSRKKPNPQIPYFAVVEMKNKGVLKIELGNKRLAREIILCSWFPMPLYTSYIMKLRILRFLYFVVLSAFGLFQHLNDRVDELAYIVFFGLIGSLLLRHYLYNQLLGGIAKEALQNKELYELVASLGEWHYFGSGASSVIASLQEV